MKSPIYWRKILYFCFLPAALRFLPLFQLDIFVKYPVILVIPSIFLNRNRCHLSVSPLDVFPQETQFVNSGENADSWSLSVSLKTFITKLDSDSLDGFDSPSQMWLIEPASISGWKSPSILTLSIGCLRMKPAVGLNLYSMSGLPECFL